MAVISEDIVYESRVDKANIAIHNFLNGYRANKESYTLKLHSKVDTGIVFSITNNSNQDRIDVELRYRTKLRNPEHGIIRLSNIYKWKVRISDDVYNYLELASLLNRINKRELNYILNLDILKVDENIFIRKRTYKPVSKPKKTLKRYDPVKVIK